MCWFSAEYANHVEDAKAGQRLGIRTMNWHANWVVRETELESPTPCPVCLKDRTRVLFRFSESQQTQLRLGPEAEAVFKMLKRPKQDTFELADGRQIALGDMPTGLIFDVLVIPGSEQLSAVLEKNSAAQDEEDRGEPLLARLWAHF
jgi:hypothetical protein